ncbi:MAG: hypothetical protein AVDCRST_MAG26-2844 [uncultured Chloroflexia bacterium]|uniref:Oxygen sensor histidine kinase NreB n=1 Tax=uncultured Chloroflexia bacterium TaxID=1672391 RepID=A0A6J4J9G5_9CHLR|nr:MAG: hypothetical protein AVDCRST_MAG26-2844 [uncultured Chloroflexia bacterium]
MNTRQAQAQAIVHTTSPAIPGIHGRWLALARGVWVVLSVLSVGLYLASLPIDYRNRLPALQAPEVRANLAELGLSVEFTAAYLVALTLLFTSVCCVVGVIVFARGSGDPMALLVSLLLVVWGTQFPGTTLALADLHPALRWLVSLLEVFGLPLLVLFFYIFPDGRLVPRWMMGPAAIGVGTQVLAIFFPRLNPFAATPAVAIPFTLGLFGTMLFAQIYRYRRVSGPVQRQQTKWVVFGFAGAIVVLMAAILLPVLFRAYSEPGTLSSFANTTMLYAAFLLMPLSIGGAILRYRLWDIDLLVNRTLVYGALTAAVVGLYMLVVVGLGALLEVEGNVLLSLLATGLIAVVFAPLHRRLQRGVNRLIYGERDDPYRVLSRLGQRLEATLEPQAVLRSVVQTVREALRLAYAAIELRQEDGLRIAASGGDPVTRPLRLPLAYQGEQVGELVLGPRAGEGAFSPADRRLLEDLARQAGVAVHAVRLTADLQRSRERLVTAREEERRRLRHDLHDGLGPALASMSLQLAAARNLVADRPEAAELLTTLKAQMHDAVADIRGVVYALRPPVLDELGLVAAIDEYAARYRGSGPDAGLHAAVEAPPSLPPLSAAVEVAAYRIALEALTNVARHSGAHSCTIRLAIAGGALRLEVVDDGHGLRPDTHTGTGLISMRERAQELGGTFEIEGTPGEGTMVRARLPLGESDE